MKQETFDKLIRRSYDLLDMIPHEKNRHFSFILKKNKIVSFGWNQIKKTNTLCWKHKYEYPYIHSEISAIRNFEYPASLFSRCELVNVRVGKNNDISLSKPCEDCIRMLACFDFRKVWYTNENGLFVPF